MGVLGPLLPASVIVGMLVMTGCYVWANWRDSLMLLIVGMTAFAVPVSVAIAVVVSR